MKFLEKHSTMSFSASSSMYVVTKDARLSVGVPSRVRSSLERGVSIAKGENSGVGKMEKSSLDHAVGDLFGHLLVRHLVLRQIVLRMA